MKFKAHNYQRYAINHVINNEKAGLFLDMGLGKTISTLTAIQELIFLGYVNKVLVIAPKRVAEDTWSTEVEKWDHINLRVSKILGDAKKRIRAINEEADIYVINRENVVWLVDHYRNNWIWDTLVIDELSSFKSSSSKRFRAMKKIRKNFKRIIGLTGTPTPNGLLDLWPQLFIIDGGERLGTTITGYRERYFTPGQRNQNIIYEWKLKEGSEEAIHKKISDICISMKSEDYLDLPKQINNIIKIELPDSIKKQYKQFEKELVLEEENIIASSKAVLCNKLLQLANGAIYKDDKSFKEYHNEKIKALEEIIDISNGKPILVFYNFKSDLERIKSSIKNCKELKDQKDIKLWNEGKIPVLLVHPASAGHGLNLQYGGNIIVWFGLTWSLELYQQANARLHRQGQTNSVIVHHLVSSNTVDEDVLKALENKEVNQNLLLEAVKARIKEFKANEKS